MDAFEKLKSQIWGKTKEKKTKINYICSAILNDGLAEMIYNFEKSETKFAVFKKGEISCEDEIILNKQVVKPLSAEKDIIKNKVILLPTKPEEYGSDEELLKLIQEFIHKYLQVSPSFEEISVYYVLFTWIYDRFGEVPYLRFIGDWGTGKSRAEKTIGSLCYKAIIAGGAITASPVFRILENVRGTLIIDEADFKISDNWAEIVKILNCGYEKGFPVLRSEGRDSRFETKAFYVYGPKILATRKPFEDQALESRCLTEEMEKKTRDDIPLNLPEEFWEEATQIRNKLLMWRFRNFNKIELNPELVDKTIEPRLNQVMIPLLSIIKDEKARFKIKSFIKQYNSELLLDRGMEFKAEVLEVIIKLMEDGEEPTMKEIAYELDVNYGHEDEKYRGKKFTPKGIGFVVRKDLKIRPKKTREGYIVPQTEKDRIDRLKERFGIKKDLEAKDQEELQEEADELIQQAL